jgi:Transposase
MTVTIVETGAQARAITGGVDTHADVHVAAALDPVGGLLGVREFPATLAGYTCLLGWLSGFGTVCLVGVEGTGSYGAGLARHIAAAGIRVAGVDRADRQDRRRRGKPRPAGCGQRRPGGPVRPGGRRAEGTGRFGRGDPGADGRPGAPPAPSGSRRSARPGP